MINTFLMYKDKNFDVEKEIPWNGEELIQDLELNIVFKAMARDDEFILDIVKKGILTSLKKTEEILYRQDVLKDCFRNKEVVRSIYEIATSTIENDKKFYFGLFNSYPSTILYRSVGVMEMFVSNFENLRKISDDNQENFKSKGFKEFFKTISIELSDGYIEEVKAYLKKLRFKDGIFISAELGEGNKGVNYVLRTPKNESKSWIGNFIHNKMDKCTFTVAERDESGINDLSNLENRGLNFVANSLAQTADGVLGYFKRIKSELAFYIGALNLYEELEEIGQKLSFPTPTPMDERELSFENLSDISLVLNCRKETIGNSIVGKDKGLIMITGANQGGKSTFLRSVGLAQIMMQSGIFVAADNFKGNICEGLFTHFRREEDSSMESGKFDEELSRMSNIVEHISKNSFIIFNESFASTNEREGSKIAKEIISALRDKEIKILFVTHLFELASNLHGEKTDKDIFLRAERKDNGERTFKIIEGNPLRTSYGEDLYKKIFYN